MVLLTYVFLKLTFEGDESKSNHRVYVLLGCAMKWWYRGCWENDG